SSQFGQCGPDQLCGGFAATARVKCGPDPPIGVSAGVAKGDEGTHCIIRCRARRRRRGPRSLAEPIELVSQIEDETLGLLPSYARNALKCRDILFSYRADETVGREGRQQSDCERGPHTIRC